MGPRVRHWFGALEIDVSDVPKLFLMLDDGDGQISKEEFIYGLKKVKGVAQSIDLLALTKECQRMGKTMGLERRQTFDFHSHPQSLTQSQSEDAAGPRSDSD